MVLLAAEHVFTHVPPLVESLLSIRVSTTQVYRRTQAAALRAGQPAALLCVVRSEDGSPGRQGSKMAVTATATTSFIGGGVMNHK